ALELVHQPDPLATLRHVVEQVRVDPDDRLIHGAIAAVSSLDAKRLKELSVGTFVYAAVFLVEGGGLLLRARWAEYLTTGVTASFVPFELYELGRHPSLLKAAGVAVNVLIVVYLVRRLRQARAAARGLREPSSPAPRRRLS
ncbi:MAG TPA: DUF2127 domain-containing protein, partial [Polyangiaceae bacterium]|nr:DUF2127 domain-containing protein [Polyangiaceae bacterium]